MAPLFAEADAPLLKTYLINRLESASEADPDVLSDYILALLRHDQPPAEVMATCIAQLSDFMTSGIISLSSRPSNELDPTTFVKDLFETLAVYPLLSSKERTHGRQKCICKENQGRDRLLTSPMNPRRLILINIPGNRKHIRLIRNINQ